MDQEHVWMQLEAGHYVELRVGLEDYGRRSLWEM